MVNRVSRIKFHTIAQQVALHLRDEIGQGRWSMTMPGKPFLAKELGLNDKTVEVALCQLEKEGVLEGQGPGRPRKIAPRVDGDSVRPLRLGILPWDANDHTTETIMELLRRMREAGHFVTATPKTLVNLKMRVPSVARIVGQNQADAWLVSCGSAEVLEWFSKCKLPAFAIFGSMVGIPIAGIVTDRREALTEVIDTLVKLGHHSIVMLLRKQHRLPKPGITASIFLKALASYGIKKSAFCLPDWEESAQGLQECLSALFKITPPTAMIVDEPLLFSATLQFLATRGLRVPQDVSLVYQGHEPVFDWCVPKMASIETDLSGVVRCAMRWAKNVSEDKIDLRQHIVSSKYVPGGTIGPVSQKSVS